METLDLKFDVLPRAAGRETRMKFRHLLNDRELKILRAQPLPANADDEAWYEKVAGIMAEQKRMGWNGPAVHSWVKKQLKTQSNNTERIK